MLGLLAHKVMLAQQGHKEFKALSDQLDHKEFRAYKGMSDLLAQQAQIRLL
jgi:hypothetical protein